MYAHEGQRDNTLKFFEGQTISNRTRAA